MFVPARDLRLEARNLEVDSERWLRVNQLLTAATGGGRDVLPEYVHLEVLLASVSQGTRRNRPPTVNHI